MKLGICGDGSKTKTCEKRCGTHAISGVEREPPTHQSLNLNLHGQAVTMPLSLALSKGSMA